MKVKGLGDLGVFGDLGDLGDLGHFGDFGDSGPNLPSLSACREKRWRSGILFFSLARTPQGAAFERSYHCHRSAAHEKRKDYKVAQSACQAEAMITMIFAIYLYADHHQAASEVADEHTLLYNSEGQ